LQTRGNNTQVKRRSIPETVAAIEEE